jgi:excisionase family DNA binding protein
MRGTALPAGCQPLLTVAEAAAILRRTEDTVRSYVRRGFLPAHRMGTRDPLTIRAADLDAFIDRHPATPRRQIRRWRGWAGSKSA